MSKTVKVGLIGAGFVTDLHAFSFQKYVTNAEIVAVASATPGKAAHFAKERGIPHAFDNYRDLLALKDIDVITVAIPNDLHAQVTVDAARAGKHVICEKPLCKTLEEADQMIDECRQARRAADVRRGTVLRAEVRARQNAGRRRRVRQRVPGEAVGRALRPAHAVVLGRQAIGRRRDDGHGLPLDRVLALGARQAAGQERLGHDGHVCARRQDAGRRSFDCGDRVRRQPPGLAEDSWAKPGGMDDRVEIYGSQRPHARRPAARQCLDHVQQHRLRLRGREGRHDEGWTFTTFEETWNYGFPQEMQHFVDCVAGTETPIETGEDGREVLKIIYAAYQSAGEGRKIEWPYAAAAGREADRFVEEMRPSPTRLRAASPVHASTACGTGEGEE